MSAEQALPNQLPSLSLFFFFFPERFSLGRLFALGKVRATHGIQETFNHSRLRFVLSAPSVMTELILPDVCWVDLES